MKHTLALTGALLLLSSAPLAAQQTPGGALDDAWTTVCSNATPGTDFFNRCQEIINAGPGSGDRRSAAATGNNLGTTGAQGRAANIVEETRGAEGVDYEENFGRFSLHFNTSYRSTDRDPSDFENGFDSDFWGANGGFDYRLNDAWSIGAVLGYQDANTDFDAGAGNLDTSGWSLTGVLNGAFGSNGYFGAYASAGSLDYDTRRNIAYTLVLNAGTPDQTTTSVSAVASGNTDADQVSAGSTLGWGWTSGALKYGFDVAVDYLDTDIDGYTEQGGGGLAQRFEDQSVQSLTGSVTGNLSYSTSHEWGVLIPYARLRFEHEFDDDARTLSSSFAGDPNGNRILFDTEAPDRNYATGALGITGVSLSGTSWYVEAQRLFMHEFLSEWAANAGVRFEF